MLMYGRDSIGYFEQTLRKNAIFLPLRCATKTHTDQDFKIHRNKSTVRRISFYVEACVGCNAESSCVFKNVSIAFELMPFVDWCQHNIYADFCKLQFALSISIPHTHIVFLFHAQNGFLFDWIAPISDISHHECRCCRLFHRISFYKTSFATCHSVALANHAEF